MRCVYRESPIGKSIANGLLLHHICVIYLHQFSLCKNMHDICFSSHGLWVS
jgi:hypothetical protein